MRKINLVIMSCMLLFASCEKEDAEILSSKLVLNELTIENSKIKVDWNRPYVPGFKYYIVYKTSSPLFDVSDYYYSNNTRIEDADETIFYDDLSLEEDIYYTVAAFSSMQEPIVSSSVQLKMDELAIFNSKPDDIVHYPSGNKLFIFMESNIYSYDYSLMSITDTVTLNSNVNYGSLGVYNSKQELYVACSSGDIKIFDANSLSLISSISVGSEVSSFISDNKGNLYAKVYESYDWKVISYDRKTLSENDSYFSYNFDYKGRIKHLNGMDRIIELRDYSYSSYIYYYDHDESGLFTGANYNYDYNSDKDAKIFEIFSDDRLITGREGGIYSSELIFITELGDYYEYFNDFCVDDNIYAAVTNYKKVNVYSKSNYSLINSYDTGLYPVYIFKSENEIIVFGSNNQDYDYYSNSKFTIEKITLN